MKKQDFCDFKLKVIEASAKFMFHNPSTIIVNLKSTLQFFQIEKGLPRLDQSKLQVASQRRYQFGRTIGDFATQYLYSNIYFRLS